MNLITIYFDGGCSPNPGNKYGSFEVQLNRVRIIESSRAQFGYGTNNEAEFESLRMALKHLDLWLCENFRSHAEFDVQIETDSVIVQNRLIKKNRVHSKPAWKQASERMFNLAESCLVFLRKYKSFGVIWKQRESNVARFGH